MPFPPSLFSGRACAVQICKHLGARSAEDNLIFQPFSLDRWHFFDQALPIMPDKYSKNEHTAFPERAQTLESLTLIPERLSSFIIVACGESGDSVGVEAHAFSRCMGM